MIIATGVVILPPFAIVLKNIGRAPDVDHDCDVMYPLYTYKPRFDWTTACFQRTASLRRVASRHIAKAGSDHGLKHVQHAADLAVGFDTGAMFNLTGRLPKLMTEVAR